MIAGNYHTDETNQTIHNMIKVVDMKDWIIKWQKRLKDGSNWTIVKYRENGKACFAGGKTQDGIDEWSRVFVHLNEDTLPKYVTKKLNSIIKKHK